MRVRKCDRCGNVYTPNENNERFHVYRREKYFVWTLRPVQLDLCGECEQELGCWLEEKVENK